MNGGRPLSSSPRLQSRPRLALALLGPTGAGKSELALRLAQQLPLEVISVDSALVYCGLDIGTAKPTRTERAQLPHHLIDIRDAAQSYSAGEFAADAQGLLAQIHARGRTPLLVGGTMLYFRALLEGLADLPRAQPAIRAQIDAEASERGWPALHGELARVDAAAAAKIHPNDAQRIQRALEVFRATGQRLSDLQRPLVNSANAPRRASEWQFVSFALLPLQRELLHARLAQRFEGMLADGLLEEVRGLHARGDLSADNPAIRSVGYRQLWEYCEGHCEFDAACKRAVVATRQLAKRQLTWLRGSSQVVSAQRIEAFASDTYERFADAALQAVERAAR